MNPLFSLLLAVLLIIPGFFCYFLVALLGFIAHSRNDNAQRWQQRTFFSFLSFHCYSEIIWDGLEDKGACVKADDLNPTQVVGEENWTPHPLALWRCGVFSLSK